MARKLIINDKRAVIGGKKKGTVTIDGVAYPFDNRNILNFPEYEPRTSHGITSYSEGGIIHINGTPDLNWSQIYYSTIQLQDGWYSLKSFSDNIFYLQVNLNKIDGGTLYKYDRYGEGVTFYYDSSLYSSSAIIIQCGNILQQVTDGTVKPMIIEGSTLPDEWSR